MTTLRKLDSSAAVTLFESRKKKRASESNRLPKQPKQKGKEEKSKE